MAKDVDLSSKEWRDIVFEGKNKDFGAYKMRETSVERHSKAVLYVVIALAVIMTLLILQLSGVFSSPEEDQTAISTVQEDVATYDAEDQIEDEPEIFDIPEPEPEEVIVPEEVANSQQVTAVLLVDEVDKDKEIKDTQDVIDNEAAIGAIDVTDGTNDLNKVHIQEQVVVEQKPEPKEEEVYNMAVVEQKPSFPGGDQAMYKWLSDNINYPAAAAEDGIQGRVTVQFVVGKDGSIQNVQVIRGRHPALDKEAVRVIKAMPKWVPGRNNGQPVKVTYTLPVNFKLQQ